MLLMRHGGVSASVAEAVCGRPAATGARKAANLYAMKSQIDEVRVVFGSGWAALAPPVQPTTVYPDVDGRARPTAFLPVGQVVASTAAALAKVPQHWLAQHLSGALLQAPAQRLTVVIGLDTTPVWCSGVLVGSVAIPWKGCATTSAAAHVPFLLSATGDDREPLAAIMRESKLDAELRALDQSAVKIGNMHYTAEVPPPGVPAQVFVGCDHKCTAALVGCDGATSTSTGASATGAPHRQAAGARRRPRRCGR